MQFQHCAKIDRYPAIAMLLSEWIASIGLFPMMCGTRSIHRTKATLLCQQPKPGAMSAARLHRCWRGAGIDDQVQS